jgi:peptidylprolyl isomerase
MAAAQLGDVVQVRFNCLAGNGTVIAMSEAERPLEFTVGSDRAIQGLSKALVGMHEGENKTVTVPAEEGFGPYNAKLVFRVRRAALPSEARIGDRVTALLGDKPALVWIRAFDDEFATVDGNHPLAGQTLVLQVWLIGIRTPATGVQGPARSPPTAGAVTQSQPTGPGRRQGLKPGQRNQRRKRL